MRRDFATRIGTSIAHACWTSQIDAVLLFERYTKGGEDPNLKDWAGATLPALQHHLDMAQDMTRNRK